MQNDYSVGIILFIRLNFISRTKNINTCCTQIMLNKSMVPRQYRKRQYRKQQYRKRRYRKSITANDNTANDITAKNAMINLNSKKLKFCKFNYDIN